MLRSRKTTLTVIERNTWVEIFLIKTNISHLIYLESILEDLTPYDVRQLVMMEDEMAEIKASCEFLYFKY